MSRGLTPLVGPAKPMRFAVYDPEWYPERYELRLVGCQDEDGYRSYTSIGDFLEQELVPENSGTTYFAHAGGLSDIQFVFEYMIKIGRAKGFSIDAAMSGSAAIRCTLTRGALSWIFADSYWLFRDRLSKIGESLGLPKLSDYRCPGWPGCGHYCENQVRDGTCEHPLEDGCGMCVFYAPDAILKTYNERDCDILYQGIGRFQNELQELGGQLKRTIAATALDLFRRSCLKDSIPTDPHLNWVMRAAYIASRVEVLGPECGDANYLDFNSSFSDSMMRPQPGMYLGKTKSFSNQPCAFVRARVHVPEMYVPPLPYRHPKTGAVFFPTGTWTGLFTTTDLELLEEAGGRILKVHVVYRFLPQLDLAAYVSEIYERRKSTQDSFMRIVYKYLLNALYGKFGEAENKRRIVFSDDPEGLPGYEDGLVEYVQPGVFLVQEFNRVEHAHVAISATITSMSRALLTRALWAATQENDRAYYADTDSVVTTRSLPTGSDLGALKLEQTVGSGRFLAPKMYMLDNKPKCKGFPRLTRDWFDRIARGEPYTVRRMARLWEMLCSEEGPMCAPSDRIYDKHVRLLARPKRASQEPNNTRPWSVQELA